MSKKINCPKCFKEISDDSIFEQMTICDCGQTIHLDGYRARQSNSKASLLLVVFCLFLMGGFIHAVNWDKHSIEIIPLKTKQLLGVAKIPDLKRVAEICAERKKYFCEERALSTVVELDSSDHPSMLKLGQLQMNREAHDLAIRTYSSYFTAKGKDKKARLNLAIALDHRGQSTEALRHLKYLVYSNRNQLQPEAARAYVGILMKNGRLTEAQSAIRFCRGIGTSASLFMEKEWKEVRKRLKLAAS